MKLQQGPEVVMKEVNPQNFGMEAREKRLQQATWEPLKGGRKKSMDEESMRKFPAETRCMATSSRLH